MLRHARARHRWRRAALALAAGAVASVGADIVTVPYSDASIQYNGGFGTAPFNETYAGPGLSANSSVCAINATAMWTDYLGASFQFSFIGVSVSVVMATSDRHGVFNVTLDAAVTQHDGYTAAPTCGTAFSASGLAAGAQHELLVEYVAHSPQSSSGDEYMTVFSIIYDTGTTGQTAPFVTSVPPARTTLHVSAAPDTSTPSVSPTTTAASGGGSGVGAVAGGAVAGLAAGVLLALFVAWLLLRRSPRDKEPPQAYAAAPAPAPRPHSTMAPVRANPATYAPYAPAPAAPAPPATVTPYTVFPRTAPPAEKSAYEALTGPRSESGASASAPPSSRAPPTTRSLASGPPPY